MSIINVHLLMKLNPVPVMSLANEAARKGLRDTVVSIVNDAVKDSPILTGHNRRSMMAEVSGMGAVEKGKDAKPDRQVDDKKNQGAVYSTSGYGGYLEVGTVKMKARPYIKPAFDRQIGNLPKNIKKHFDAASVFETGGGGHHGH